MAVAVTLTVTPSAPNHGDTVTARYVITGNDPVPPTVSTVTGQATIGTEVLAVSTTPHPPGRTGDAAGAAAPDVRRAHVRAHRRPRRVHRRRALMATVTGQAVIGGIVYQASATLTLPVTTQPPGSGDTGVPVGTTLRQVPAQLSAGPGWSWTGHAVNITADNAVLDALDIAGPIYSGGTDARTAHTYAKITRCRIRCTGEQNWGVNLGPGGLLQDCEVGGGASGSSFVGAIGVLAGRWDKAQATATIERCHIHHVEHGGRSDGNAHWLGNCIADLPINDPSNHTDGVMITAGDDNTFIGNTFAAAVNNSLIFVQGQAGNAPIGRMTISGNRFACIGDQAGQWPSWAISIEAKNLVAGAARSITGNTFERGWGGSTGGAPVNAPAGTTLSNNLFTDGSPIPRP